MRPWLVAALWIAWCLFAVGSGQAGPQSGDRNDERATSASVLADVATMASMAGALAAAIWVPSAAIPGDPWLIVGLGLALVVLGIGVRGWAAGTLGRFFTRSITIRDGHCVVTSGPYRFIRHPGYTGLLVSLAGLALTLGNWLGVVLMMVGSVLAQVPRIKAEEAVLEANLGEPYRAFERTRKRLIPGVW